MSEKRVCSASRSFAPLIGLFAAPNRPRNAPNSKIPLRKPLFQADSMRLWRIHSAKGAFTLSIDLNISVAKGVGCGCVGAVDFAAGVEIGGGVGHSSPNCVGYGRLSSVGRASDL